MKRPAKAPKIWRQGDVYLVAIDSIPRGKCSPRRPVLAEGEITGHAHRISDPTAAEVFECDDELYMNVVGDTATVVHEEHGPITVPHGTYEIRIQREYTPQEIRRVVD